MLNRPNSKQGKSLMDRVNELINLGVYNDSAIAELVGAKYGLPTLTPADAQQISEFTRLALEQPEGSYDQRKFLNQAAKIVTSKMPSTLKDKVIAARRIAMLMNPKTLISRNAGGNLIFGVLEDFKDLPGTLIDLAVSAKNRHSHDLV